MYYSLMIYSYVFGFVNVSFSAAQTHHQIQQLVVVRSEGGSAVIGVPVASAGVWPGYETWQVTSVPHYWQVEPFFVGSEALESPLRFQFQPQPWSGCKDDGCCR